MEPGSLSQTDDYALRYSIDYPQHLDRLTTFFRLIWIVPIAIVYSILSTTSYTTEIVIEGGEIIERATWTSGGILASLAVVIGLLILFRQKYPRWWFDFAAELIRFATRIGAYFALQTDVYPSTDEHQSIHVEIDYPDAKNGLNRWMPLIKWLLAIPHYFVLVFLGIGAIFAVIIAWFAILFTGRYPRGLFDYVAGVTRWGLRVYAYALLLVTDKYPPFTLR
jgi:Domain of unknown function (DUF4389)